MDIKKIRKNNGISIVDILIAMTILTMFVGVIGSLYYQIAYNSNLVRLNAVAVYYSIKIAEDIDKMDYDLVNNNLNNNIKTTYGIPDPFSITLQVKNYNDSDASKQDLIKIVNIKVSYLCFNQTKNYEIQKLKVKEI